MLFKKEYNYPKIKIKDLLPIGTIITLTTRPEKFIILSYGGFIKDKNTKIYNEKDYIIGKYPFVDLIEDINTDYTYITSNEIKEVVFMGYDSEERKKFLDEIDWRSDRNNE